MEFLVDDIKKDVRVIMAENENISPLVTDGSIDDYIALERDTLIEDLICKAVDRIHLYAPSSMIRDASILPKNTTWETPATTDYCNKTNLSATKFIRLNFVRLPDWRQPVYDVTDVDSVEYEQAQSPFPIMRPSTRHPMVAIRKDGNGIILEAYPKTITTANASNTHCYIVEKAEFYTNSVQKKAVNIAQQCYTAVLYTIANLYYVSINETEKANAMAKEVADILGIEDK